jgi:hypothetical protein
MHDNSWFRATLSISLSKNLQVDAELQHRRQNGFSNSDMLDKSLMASARTWVHYRYRPDIRFSASPFAFFLHQKPIVHESDEKAASTQEIRFALAAELRHDRPGRVSAFYRASLEYRLLNNYPASVIRFRNRLGLTCDIHRKLQMFVYDELFLNADGINPAHVFDHNRIAAGFACEMAPAVKLEAGYVYISRLPLQAEALLYENNVFVSLTFRLHRN